MQMLYAIRLLIDHVFDYFYLLLLFNVLQSVLGQCCVRFPSLLFNSVLFVFCLCIFLKHTWSECETALQEELETTTTTTTVTIE